MSNLGYLGTLGKKVQQVASPVVKKPEEVIQVVEVPIVPEPEPEPVEVPTVPEPETIQVVEIPIVSEPEPEPIQAEDEEQYASLPVLASIVSSHTESSSE
jgi:hypothetical protein